MLECHAFHHKYHLTICTLFVDVLTAYSARSVESFGKMFGVQEGDHDEDGEEGGRKEHKLNTRKETTGQNTIEESKETQNITAKEEEESDEGDSDEGDEGEEGDDSEADD